LVAIPSDGIFLSLFRLVTIEAGMRASEGIHIVVFTFLISLAWIRPLPSRRRVKVTAIGLAGLSVTIVAACLLTSVLPALVVSVVRDWVPAALVLLVYWQTGQFFTKVDQRFQDRLERIDERMLAPLLHWLSHRPLGICISTCLELAYLLCYTLIPMSMATLYLLRMARYADTFWTVALVSTYLSYALLPFVQTLPPRMLVERWLEPLPPNPARRFNLWILRHASIHANTFPSAHVAASVGSALVLTSLAPLPVGLVFSTVAMAIAVGTFSGRYHFLADAVAGTAVAVIVFELTKYFRGF
jgi:PAP2 superfamily